jgi:hypothetical protein
MGVGHRVPLVRVDREFVFTAFANERRPIAILMDSLDDTALSGCSASGVAGLSSAGMWLCGDLGQAAAGTPTTSFQAVNRVSISWR